MSDINKERLDGYKADAVKAVDMAYQAGFNDRTEIDQAERDTLVEVLMEARRLLFIECNQLEKQRSAEANNRWFGRVNDFLNEGLPIRWNDWIEKMNEEAREAIAAAKGEQ